MPPRYTPPTLISVVHGLIKWASVLKRGGERDAQMDGGEAVAIVTQRGNKLRGPEEQLPDQRPAAMLEDGGVREGPTAGRRLAQ